VQRVAGRRPRREPPDLAGAPARHLQELPCGKQATSKRVSSTLLSCSVGELLF
jgi:hypothetical protein